jgi:hypothetical protein
MRALTHDDRESIRRQLVAKGVDQTTITTIMERLAWPGQPSQAYEIRVSSEEARRLAEEAPPPGAFG